MRLDDSLPSNRGASASLTESRLHHVPVGLAPRSREARNAGAILRSRSHGILRHRCQVHWHVK